MKKIGIYIIIFILVILFRDNISFFYGNVLGVFKLNNNYYDAIININEEKIKYLEKEIRNINNFSKDIELIKYTYRVSKIIYKESYKTNKYLLQYGEIDRVKVGNGVTNEYGLIGKITKTNEHTSELTTLKELSDLSVRVNESYGQLYYDKKTNQFMIKDISNYDKVYINDEVYTSGYGSIKEKLYVGKVIRVINNDISKTIIIETSVDLNNLNYVLIVGDFS